MNAAMNCVGLLSLVMAALPTAAQNGGTVWAVGTTGTLIKSLDDGDNWALQTSGTNSTLYDIDFVGSNLGWIVGANVTMRTTNGGQTWTNASHGYVLRAVEMFNSTTGWAVGTTGTILKTTNGGATWSPQSSGVNSLLHDVFFVDANHGWIVGANVTLKTVNGGSTWTSQFHGYVLNALYFTSSTTGWAVGNLGSILKTLDAGATWSPVASPTAFNLTGIDFISSSAGDISGDKAILRTTNGSSWTQTYSGGASLFDVAFKNASVGWAVGSTGSLLKSTDGGASWMLKNSGTSAPLQAVLFSEPATPPTITTISPLPNATQGAFYSVPLAATGGLTPYTWALAAGSLPSGLSLNSGTGTISGTPSSFAAYSFTVGVTGANGATSTKVLSLTVEAAAPTITTASPLPSGTASVPYSRTFAATGGSTPYSWSIAAGNLPSGLSLSSAGVLSGTPTTAGNYGFTVGVAGSNGASSTKVFALAIQQASAPTITTNSPLPSGLEGTAYSVTLAASGGVTPYSWDVSGGLLPPGLNLGASSGTINGLPTTPGDYGFTTRVTGSNGASSTKLFVLAIQSLAPTITTPTPLPNGTVLASYGATLSAAGGTTPYSWSVSAGALPPGLSLGSMTGAITGVPSVVGGYSFTIRVVGSDAHASTKDFSLIIQAAAAPTVTTISPLPPGFVSVSYAVTLNATGGALPYSWSVVGGSLPVGLGLGGLDGVISGTPMLAGTSAFDVQVVGNDGLASSKSFSLTVRAPTQIAMFSDGTFSSWSAAPRESCVGLFYSANDDSSGGNPAAAWHTMHTGGMFGPGPCQTPFLVYHTPSDPGATFDPGLIGGVGTIEFSVDMKPVRLQWGICCGQAECYYIIVQGGAVYRAHAFTLYTANQWRSYRKRLAADDFTLVCFPCPLGAPSEPNLTTGSPFAVGLMTAYWPLGSQGNIIENVFDNFQVDLYAEAPYGSGLNPADSLTLMSGTPSIGGVVGFGIDNPLGTQAPGAIPILAIALNPDQTQLPGWGMRPPSFVGERLIGGPHFGMEGGRQVAFSTISPATQLGLGRVIGPPWAGTGFPSQINVSIPNNPSLIGRTFYAQGLLFDEAGTMGATFGLTNGLRVVIGP